MFNPFTEVIDESADFDLISQAKNGNRDALEKLVLRHQAWIYNIALRMVFHPQDAEEVTQEVLIKALTRLITFQGDSQFRTWLYRITADHELNMKMRSGETQCWRSPVTPTLSTKRPTSTCLIRRAFRRMCRLMGKPPPPLLHAQVWAPSLCCEAAIHEQAIYGR